MALTLLKNRSKLREKSGSKIYLLPRFIIRSLLSFQIINIGHYLSNFWYRVCPLQMSPQFYITALWFSRDKQKNMTLLRYCYGIFFPLAKENFWMVLNSSIGFYIGFPGSLLFLWARFQNYFVSFSWQKISTKLSE